MDAELEKYAFWLANIDGIGNRTIRKLLQIVGSEKELFCLSEREIKELLNVKQAECFIRSRDWKTIEENFLCLQRKEIRFVSIHSQLYPQRLRPLDDMPYALYVKGNLPKEDEPTVAIIGARACSDYGKRCAYQFGKELAYDGIQVISGLARGVDGIGQQGAIDVGCSTYAVLGNGVEVCYPKENQALYQQIPSKGGLISEYTPWTQPLNSLFPARNRIISGLADAVLVVEAKKRSGTYITVTQALEQGKEVFAIPGRITDALSDGCNFLLKEGASIALHPQNIIESLRSRVANVNNVKSYAQTEEIIETEEKTIKPEMDRLENVLLHKLDINPLGLNEILEKIEKMGQWRYEDILLSLTKLQMIGKVEKCGNSYKLTTR